MDRRRSLLKIAALRSERERQVGVNIGKEQNIDSSSITAFIGAPVPIGTGDFTLEYFGNAYWATKSKTPLIFNDSTHSTYSKGSFLVYGDSELAIRWVLFEAPMSGAPTDDSILLSAGDRETPFHFVVTRKGTTVKAYFNGELKATKEQSAVKDLGDFRLGMSNGSNMVMTRIYNYALSAEEVAALYNDGDPAGYVLPGTMKGLMPVEIVGENSHTWTGVDDSNYSHIVRVSRPFTIGQLYKIRFIVSNWEAGNNPFIKIGTTGSYYLPDFNGNGTYEIYATPNGTPYSGVYVYAGLLNTDRRMTITVDSIELVGCIAEYLPQNLVGQWHEKPFDLSGQNSYTWTGETDTIYSRSVLLGRTCKSGTAVSVKGTVSDYQSGAPFIYAGRGRVDIPAKDGDFTVMVTGLDAFDRVSYYGGLNGSDRRLTITIDSVDLIPDVALAWLDSARQLPLNDEYLPPLFESIVIGDATPIHITGENSYTWTGADDRTYGKLIPISRTLNVGSRYRISVTVSDYEAGSPFINISGTDSASIPSANGTYELELAYTADYPNRIILYGGQSGTDRRLTLTVNSIEPIVEHSYDLTANGMPQIIIK
jgi:hypothetical protein